MLLTHAVSPDFALSLTAPVPRPPADALDRAEAIWREETARLPSLYNGRIFSVERLEGSLAVGFFAPYMWHVAQFRQPELFEHFRVRSLAVSGLVQAAGHVVFGLRRRDLVVEPGLWESAPTGTIDDTRLNPDGSPCWRAQFLAELAEELGLSARAEALTSVALVEDTVTHIIELGVAVSLPVGPDGVLAAFVGVDKPEHDQLSIVPVADVNRFYATRNDQLVAACAPLLIAGGLLDPDAPPPPPLH